MYSVPKSWNIFGHGDKTDRLLAHKSYTWKRKFKTAGIEDWANVTKQIINRVNGGKVKKFSKIIP